MRRCSREPAPITPPVARRTTCLGNLSRLTRYAAQARLSVPPSPRLHIARLRRRRAPDMARASPAATSWVRGDDKTSADVGLTSSFRASKYAAAASS